MYLYKVLNGIDLSHATLHSGNVGQFFDWRVNFSPENYTECLNFQTEQELELLLGNEWNKKLNNLTGKEWIKFTKSWFIVNPKRRTKDSVNHPGKFPEELVEKYIKFFTKNGYVLDPFLGVGSTLIACENTQRNGIGIELSKEFSDIARSELKKIKPKKNQKVIVGDSANIDKIFKRKNINIPKKLTLSLLPMEYAWWK